MIRAATLVVLVACKPAPAPVATVAPELLVGGPYKTLVEVTGGPRALSDALGKEVTTLRTDEPPIFAIVHRGLFEHRWGLRLVDGNGRVCRTMTMTERDPAARTSTSYAGSTGAVLRLGAIANAPAARGPCEDPAAKFAQLVPGHYTATFTLDDKVVTIKTFDVTPN